MSREVYIDEDECIACGMCQDICPEVIKPQGGPEDLIQEAIDACPVSCIHWKE